MSTVNSFYIGIDGGGTSCRARICDESLNILGEARSGSANVFQNYELAWQSVNTAITEAGLNAGLSKTDLQSASVIAGLAGAEVSECAQQFMSLAGDFRDFTLLTDAQIACLGAHEGEDGAVFIIGTGSIGVAYNQGDWQQIGGWGFPLDDIGSGAWLGQQAIRNAIRQRDGLEQDGVLSQSVWLKFSDSKDALIRWSQTASSGDYGQFAPLVLEAFGADDPAAKKIISIQINEITKQINQLVTNERPLSLMGGLSEWVLLHLESNLRNNITPAKGDALSGALKFAQKRNEI
jgi:glucosamine kinase